MKFLVLYSQGQNPPADAVDELAAGSKRWAGGHMRESRIETTYLFPDGGGFAIFDVDSLEVLQKILHENPASPFLNHEVRPLLDFDSGLDQLQERFRDNLQSADRIAARHARGEQSTPPS